MYVSNTPSVAEVPRRTMRGTIIETEIYISPPIFAPDPKRWELATIRKELIYVPLNYSLSTFEIDFSGRVEHI